MDEVLSCGDFSSLLWFEQQYMGKLILAKATADTSINKQSSLLLGLF
jgi:hypothetical protein